MRRILLDSEKCFSFFYKPRQNLCFIKQKWFTLNYSEINIKIFRNIHHTAAGLDKHFSEFSCSYVFTQSIFKQHVTSAAFSRWCIESDIWFILFGIQLQLFNSCFNYGFYISDLKPLRFFILITVLRRCGDLECWNLVIIFLYWWKRKLKYEFKKKKY